MENGKSLVTVRTDERKLTAAEFQTLADVPPEIEWFANLENTNTRRAYENDLRAFHAICWDRETAGIPDGISGRI